MQLLEYHRALNQRSVALMTPLSLLRIPQTERVDGYDARLAPAPPFFYFETEEENQDQRDRKKQKEEAEQAAVDNLLNIGSNPRHPRQWQYKQMAIKIKPTAPPPPRPPTISNQPELPQGSPTVQPTDPKVGPKSPTSPVPTEPKAEPKSPLTPPPEATPPKTEKPTPGKRKASQMVTKKKALWKTTTVLSQTPIVKKPFNFNLLAPPTYPKVAASG